MKIKLKDLTQEQYDEWLDSNCNMCESCIFRDIACYDSGTPSSWIKHKNLYSEEFLNQEVELEVDILDKVEKEYLENILRPFKTRKIEIFKEPLFFHPNYEEIVIVIEKEDEKNIFVLPRFKRKAMYKGMEIGRRYTSEELGLFVNE